MKSDLQECSIERPFSKYQSVLLQNDLNILTFFQRNNHEITIVPRLSSLLEKWLFLKEEIQFYPFLKIYLDNFFFSFYSPLESFVDTPLESGYVYFLCFQTAEMLQEEKQSDDQLRAQFKEKWKRSESDKLTGSIRSNLDMYRQMIATAVNADGV